MRDAKTSSFRFSSGSWWQVQCRGPTTASVAGLLAFRHRLLSRVRLATTVLFLLVSVVALGTAPNHSEAACSTSSITSGSPVSGSLTTSDCDAPHRSGSRADLYIFLGTAGQQATIALDSSSFDTYLILVGPSGGVVTQDDDSGPGLNSLISNFTLPSSGTYTIEATSYSFATGGYTLSLSLTGTAACSTSSITSGSPVSGSLTTSDCDAPHRSGSKADLYTFSGVVGQQVRITMNSAFDTFLFLQDPSGTVIASNDDCPGGGLNSCIPSNALSGGTFTLPMSGTYTIEATSYSFATGTYSLSLAVSAALPSVTTNAASGITSVAAVLNGTINPNGSSTTGWFEWGTTNPPGTSSGVQTIGSGSSPISYTQQLSGLNPNTTYYFRAVGQGAGGTLVRGTVLSFTTNPPAPTLSAPPNGATGQSTTPSFSWSAVSGATSYRIMVATSQSALPRNADAATCSGCVINATPSGNSFTPDSGVLSAGTTYWWQVKARSPTQFGEWSSQFSFVVAPLADLIVENVTVSPASVMAGGTVNVSFGIRNQGGTAAGLMANEIRLTSASGTNVLLGNRNVSSLAAGVSTGALTQVVTIPVGTAPGSYSILVVADVADTVPESNNANNTSGAALTVTAPTIILITPPPSSIPSGQAFSVAWSVSGGIPTHVNVHWDPTNPGGPGNPAGNINPSTCLQTSTSCSTISPTSSPASLTAPTISPSGFPVTVKYLVHAIVGGIDIFSTTLSVTVNPPLPNVTLSVYRISDTSGTPDGTSPGIPKTTFTRGETVRVTLQAANTGSSVPVRAVLNLFPSGSNTAAYDSHQVGQNNSTDSPLTQGETDYYSFDWMIPGDAPTGTYDIIAAIRDLNNFNTVYDETTPGANTKSFGSGVRLLNQFTVAPTILLVHGYKGSPSAFGKMKELLQNPNCGLPPDAAVHCGFAVEELDYSDLTPALHADDFPIELIVERLKEHLEGRGLRSVDIVSHSMGGLVVRAYIAELGRRSNGSTIKYGDEIRRVITLATPHYGQPFQLADKQTDQMAYGSQFIWDLELAWRKTDFALNRLQDFMSIVARQDGIVRSQSSAAVSGTAAFYVNKEHADVFDPLGCGVNVVCIDNAYHPSFDLVRQFVSAGPRGAGELPSDGRAPGAPDEPEFRWDTNAPNSGNFMIRFVEMKDGEETPIRVSEFADEEVLIFTPVISAAGYESDENSGVLIVVDAILSSSTQSYSASIDGSNVFLLPNYENESLGSIDLRRGRTVVHHQVQLVRAGDVTTPSLVTLRPTRGPGGALVVVTGRNLGAVQGSASLQFGESAAEVQSWSDNRIQGIVPQARGTVDVFVRTRNARSSSVPFTYFSTPQFQLTVSPVPVNGAVTAAGISCGADSTGDCEQSFTEGLFVDLQANPAAGYRVGTWTGCQPISANQCTVQMTQARTVSVTFTQQTFSILGNITDGEGFATSANLSWIGPVSGSQGVNGAYAITGLPNGTYTLTPSAPGFTFSPTSRTVTVNGANVTGANFTKLDTTPPPAPIGVTASPSSWTNNNLFAIDWTNPVDPSGIAKVWYKVGAIPASPADGIALSVPQFKPFFVGATSTGGQTVYVWLEDGAGNRDHSNRSSAVLYYNGTPTANAGGPYSVNEGGSTILNGTGTDPEGDPLTFAWDLNGDGTFETQGQNVTFNTAGIDGPTSRTVTLRVTDSHGAIATSSAIVNILNVAPTITSLTATPNPANEGGLVSFNATFTDPGQVDTHAYAWNFGDGSAGVSGTLSPSHTYVNNGTFTVTLTITDDDGASASQSLVVTVNNVAPTITAVTNTGPVNEGSPVTVTITATDPGANDTFTYYFDFDNDGVFEVVQPGRSASFTFRDNGAFTVRVQVRDQDGGVSTVATTTVIVNNVPPTVNAGPNQTVDEGQVVNFAGSFTDPGADTHTIRWDFGDGAVATGTLTPSHSYADNGSYTVTLTVTDDDGGVGTSTLVVTVRNVPPTVTALAATPNPADEGTAVSFTGAFTDPGTADTHTIQWNFGDGTPAVTGTFTPTHAYAENGTYTVTLTVTDDDGGVGTRTLTVTVNNVPPTVTTLTATPNPADEGQVVTFSGAFTDPGTADTHTVSWSFGDGSPAVSGTLTPTHTYADNGTYTVTLTVTDDDGGVGLKSLVVTVNNVPPTVTTLSAAPNPASEGQAVAFTGTFTDPGTVDTHTLRWDFGDGSTATGTLTPTHTYADNGTYILTLTVTDDDGGVGTRTATVTVNNVAPTVVARGSLTASEGSLVDLTGTSFSDPGFADTHTASVNWGDGAVGEVVVTVTNPGGPGTPRQGTVAATHVYADNGVYNVEVCVTDDDGGQGCGAFTATVNNVPPTISVSGSATVDEGSLLTLTVSAPDAGAADVVTLAATELPPMATFNQTLGNPATGTLNWTPACTQAGRYPVTFRATDDDDGVAEQTITLTVTESCQPVIAVTNRDDRSVSLIDAETNQVMGTQAVGKKPVGASFFDFLYDGFTLPAKLYVAEKKAGSKGRDDEEYDDQDEQHGHDDDDDEDKQEGAIHVLVGPTTPTQANAFDFAPATTIGVGDKPAGLAINPSGTQVWVPNRNDNSISIIDRATDTIIATLPLRLRGSSRDRDRDDKGGKKVKPVAVGFSPDGQFAYVVGRNSNKLIVLDTARAFSDTAGAIVAAIEVGNKPVALAVSPDGSMVYVVNRSGNDVAVVTVGSLPGGVPVVLARIPVGKAPEGLALLPDGSKLYVTNSETNDVSVLQVLSGSPFLWEIHRIRVGQKAAGIAITRSGSFADQPFAYVANRESNTVSVIDTTTDTVIDTIPVGKGPNGVAAGIIPTAP